MVDGKVSFRLVVYFFGIEVKKDSCIYYNKKEKCEKLMYFFMILYCK